MAGASTMSWWERAVIYQVYPRSFQDSDGDGVGDLRGVIRRLDYLQWLGVDAIWLSPIYPSPMKDFGYDIVDYTDVDPIFGTLEDFDALLAEAHRRGLRLLLDLVPNHTSDQHPWFIDARSSRTSPRRDWYIWRDPRPDGSPPTNWLSNFGGSAWEFDPATGQYYYHAYLREQPDLNWRNPEVRAAMLDVMRFWLDRGVDGFRVDVIWHLVKDEQFRDNPPNPGYRPGMWPYRALLPTYTTDRPEVHEVIAEMRRLLDSYGERLMVGEIYLPVERLVAYYGDAGTGVHLPFNFQLIGLPWDAPTLAAAIAAYEGLLPAHGWPNWVLGNHDKPRIASRVGSAQARVAAMLLLTLRGTPTLYYGDELGMRDVPIPPDRVRDPWEKNTPGLGLGRDPARTPMPWDDTPGAGFTAGEPWLPLAVDARAIHVTAQRDDPSSMLGLYRRLIALRRDEPALRAGSYTPAGSGEGWLAYLRESGGRRLLVALNLGAAPLSVDVSVESSRVLLSTVPGRAGEAVGGRVALRGDEGVVLELLERP
ncbi:alpha-amylase family glycosyl hydrolase [Tautonia plasticadhaerens]|uniref:Oligo-1,6-glucosidase n=1 Tax=Tautonia plasticadhaerens TaxID=2527974 RepID=A0A518HFL1_9BACT|nr:alpha-amylase family glycosyl hydrolase [Tautonia plasticadhaerens]QDV39630.1 Oligo-1,6-glucosidase [Tautonia plasticadhaerens]